MGPHNDRRYVLASRIAVLTPRVPLRRKNWQVAHDVDSAQFADVLLDLLSGLAFDAGFRAQAIDVERTLSTIRALLEGNVLRPVI